MTLLRPRILHLLGSLAWAVLCPPARAQQPCDSLHEAGFTYQDLGGYTYQFTPAPPSGTTQWYTQWDVLGLGFGTSSYLEQPQFQLPGPGDYLACLQGTVEDNLGETCASLHCELLHVPVDPDCADLSAGFTITVGGDGIQFIDQTTSSYPVTGHTWDFGDGSFSTEAAPSHVYQGTGPFLACLTVTTANCTAMACNWIYLGPPVVPCDTLLQVDVDLLQVARSIAVFNESITSGMNASVQWDFGDGSWALGSPVLHTYAQDGDYQVCGEVKLWGPLTPDTCTATACTWVTTYQATGTATIPGYAGLHAFPSPFEGSLSVEGATGMQRWQLTDALGRTCKEGAVPASGRFTVAGHDLPAGSYLLRLLAADKVRVLRVMKAGGGS